MNETTPVPGAHTCRVESCANKTKARGLCNAHYLRQRRHGDPLVRLRTRYSQDVPCAVEECTATARSGGMCFRHYTAKWTQANPAAAKMSRDKWLRNNSGWSRFVCGRSRARKRGLSWVLTPEQHKELISQPCFYCMGQLCQSGVGLDRTDNTKGYEPGNVVPCCGSCNVIRSDKLTVPEMRAAMAAVMALRHLTQGAGNDVL